MSDAVSFTRLSAIRRSFTLFQTEMSEFLAASIAGEVGEMNKIRQRAHDYLDAYFDASNSANVVIREDAARNSH